MIKDKSRQCQAAQSPCSLDPNGQEVRTFYHSGKLESVGVYKDNILNGEYKEYDESGNLIKEILYKDGIEVKK